MDRDLQIVLDLFHRGCKKEPVVQHRKFCPLSDPEISQKSHPSGILYNINPLPSRRIPDLCPWRHHPCDRVLDIDTIFRLEMRNEPALQPKCIINSRDFTEDLHSLVTQDFVLLRPSLFRGIPTRRFPNEQLVSNRVKTDDGL